MNTKAFLEESIKGIFSEEEPSDNKKASYLLKQGLFHLKEAYLFLDGSADKNHLTTNDISESEAKAALEVANKLRELYKSIQK